MLGVRAAKDLYSADGIISGVEHNVLFQLWKPLGVSEYWLGYGVGNASGRMVCTNVQRTGIHSAMYPLVMDRP